MNTRTTRMIRAANEPAKKSGAVRRFFLRLIGAAGARAVVARKLRRKIDSTPVAFPADLTRSSEIMFILPRNRSALVYQLETVFAIVEKHTNSGFIFVCPKPYGALFENVRNGRVVEFGYDEFTVIYDAEHTRVVNEAAFAAVDICVVLEKELTLAHLFLVGACRAHLRIGWGGAQTSPFLNVRLVESEREDANLWDRNFEAARILNTQAVGAGYAPPFGQKLIGEEVRESVAKLGLKANIALICVDVIGLQNSYGDLFVKDLLVVLKRSEPSLWQYCAFGGFDGDAAAEAKYSIPTLPQMSLQNCAAMLGRCAVVICGAGDFFGLAQAAQNKIAPILTHKEAMMYCKSSAAVSPATFAEKPNADTIREVVKNVRALLSNNAQSSANNVLTNNGSTNNGSTNNVSTNNASANNGSMNNVSTNNAPTNVISK